MVANSKHVGHANPIHPVVDTFRLVAETRQQAEQIANSARCAVRAFYRNPADLATFIERLNTPVYVVHNALLSNFVLWLLGFEPGFIPPVSGKRYQWLQQFLKFQANLSSHLKGYQGDKTNCRFDHGVFVLTRPLFTVGFLSHQLHHWLAFRSGMRGYSERSQTLYKKFWNEQQGLLGAEVYDMSVEDMQALKAAINRDLEALLFLKNIANEILIPAKQAKRMPFGTTSI